MARLYEFEVNKEIIEGMVRDVELSLGAGVMGSVVDNLMDMIDQPGIFLKTLMSGKPGIHVRVGQIRTERFEGQGLHMYVHSGSEGFLDSLEFDMRLKSSLKRQGIIFQDKT